MTENTASGGYTEIPAPLRPAAWITLVNHRTPQKQFFFYLKSWEIFSCHPIPQISKHQYNRHYKIVNYPRVTRGTDFVLICYLNIIILWLFTDLFDISNLIKKDKRPIWKKEQNLQSEKHMTWTFMVFGWGLFLCVLKSDGRNITWMPTKIYIIKFLALLFCFILSSALWRKWYDFLSQSKQTLLLGFWLSNGTCSDVSDGETERSA